MLTTSNEPRRPLAPGGRPAVAVEDLVVEFATRHGRVRVLDGVTFSLKEGETLALVGESGSGKSVTAMAILGLLPHNAHVVSGRIAVNGLNVLEATQEQLRKMRGRVVSIVLQDPMTSLNPLFTVGWQVGEAVKISSRSASTSVLARVVQLLKEMGIPSPEARTRTFPHEMSGGMRQRVVGAIALAGPPQVLIADEPTTALDTTTQAQYLQLLRDVQRELGISIIFITHDFGIVAELADRVAVMYSGRIMETADVSRLFDSPEHPYTRALLESVPQLGSDLRLRAIPGQPPAAGVLLQGCPFAPRCPLVFERCHNEAPPAFSRGFGHEARCWRLE